MLTSEHLIQGIWGYLGEHLLDIGSFSGGYKFLTRDPSLAETYNFKREQSPYTGSVYYTLPAPKNAGISAFKVCSFAKYQGFDLYIENCDDKSLLVAPWDEGDFFRAYPKKNWHKGWYDSRDPRFEINEEEVTDIWEERSPIDGFDFTVEPIVYLKKDGMWLINSEEEE